MIARHHDYPTQDDWDSLRARYRVAIRRHHELERKLLGQNPLAEVIARARATRMAIKLKLKTAQQLRAQGRILRAASAETVSALRLLRGDPS